MISIDFETRSRADLKAVGAWEYSTDPSTEVLCLVVKDGSQPDAKNILWMPHPFGLTPNAVSDLAERYLLTIDERPPEFLTHHIKNGGDIVAHNAEFELAIFRRLARETSFWPDIEISQLRDTMAVSARSGLPLALEKSAELMGLDAQKNMEGSAVMKKMCAPIKTGKKKGEWYYSVEDHVRLIDYCSDDVEATYAFALSLPPLSQDEQEVWTETVRINEYGLPIDRDSVEKIIGAEKTNVEYVSLDVAAATGWDLTGDDIGRIKFLRDWLADKGYPTPTLDKAAVSYLLSQPNLPNDVKTVLEARQQLGRSATAKYKVMLNMSETDGRVRGVFVYCGASKTGRFAGRGIQPHNLPRPAMSNEAIDLVYHRLKDADDLGARQLVTSQKTKKGGLYSPAEVFGSLVRGAIKAPKGKVFMAADYRAIEARGIFWLSDCQHGMDIFADADAGTGPEPYIVMAADIYGKDPKDVDDSERAVGKTSILGCIAIGTPVLTRHGWKPIEKITPDDEIFDGMEFHKSEGSKYMGDKEILDPKYLPMTHDHDVMTDPSGIWTEAGDMNVTDLDDASFMACSLLAIKLNYHSSPTDLECTRRAIDLSRSRTDARVVPTYDVINAGPRHRFVIETGVGPLVVHNCGYGMSGPKFEMTCEGYGIELPEPPKSYMEKYEDKFQEKIKDHAEKGMRAPPYAAKGQYIVDKYRKKFPEVPQYWRDLDSAAIRAVKTDGAIQKVGQVAYKVCVFGDRRFLLTRLPSGRSLWYYNPAILPHQAAWGDVVDALHYECMSSTKSGGRMWMQISTYGAHLAENVCQGVCRDLLAYTMLNTRKKGFNTVLHVHDEIVAEVEQTADMDNRLKEYEKLVAETPHWADGFPVEAAGWWGPRYRKD